MAGKKKKGLSNRLAKMSDEERARYLQHRAAIEEEAKRRKEQLISTYMKNKIKREEAFTRLNIAKINEHWHQTLRKIKVKQLKTEIEDLSTWIVKILENKNSTINRLLEEIDESEEQYEYNFKSHLSYLDNFIDMHYERQEEQKDNYEKRKHLILEEGIRDIEKVKEKWNAEENYLKTVLFAIETTFTEEQSKLMALRQEKLEDYTNSWKAEQETMANQYHDAMAQIWSDINSTLCEYLSLTTARRHHYIELRHLDDRNTADRVHNERLITKYTILIDNLNNEYKTLVEDSEYQIKHLTDLKQTLSKRSYDLKQSLTLSIQKDEKQLKILTVQSNAIINELKRTYSTYENIQQMLACCERLETDNDKLRLKEKMKWKQQELKEADMNMTEKDTEEIEETSAENTPQKLIFHNMLKLQDDMSVCSAESLFSLMPMLQRLTKMDMICFRLNKVELDCILLKNEKSKFIPENYNLKQIIKGILRDAALTPPTPPKNKFSRNKILSAPVAFSKKSSEGSQPLSYIVLNF